MPTATDDLRTLYQLGVSWERAATAVRQLAEVGVGGAPADLAAFQAAADACRRVRAALLEEPEGPVAGSFVAATRLRAVPHALAELLEHLAGTLSRLTDSPVEAAVLSRATLARVAEFLSDCGQALLREVARSRRQAIAS